LRFRRSAPDERLQVLLEEAAGNARIATETLRDLLADYPERRHLSRELLKQEQDGDRITHDILHRLAENGVRSPFPSADVHALAAAIDDIVDYAEQTADSLGLYGVEAPMEQAQQLGEVLAQSGAAVEVAVSGLRERSELGSLLVPIHHLENEGDRLSREAIASLFARGIDPMVVIRWKDIFESLEQAIDSCETVAHVLEGIALQAS
jgi:uncharacterized protein